MSTYKIRCRVNGGVTGTREAWLKKDDVEAEFDTFEEADAEARSLMASRNNPNAVASFKYWAVKVG